MKNAVLIHQEGAVRILTNNNPTARNAISPTLYAELSAALAAAATDPSVGAVVFTGAGSFFCSGGDLNLLAKRRELPVEERREKLEGLHGLIRTIRDCSKPVIAAVEGGAAGAGMSMALACDMLVVARDAFFSVAYVKVGLTPDGGATAFLSEFVSRQVLTEMCLTGERIPAERLHALGAVNRLTEHGAALTEAIALAERVATGPLNASARIKSLCRQAHRATLEEQLDLEAAYMVQAQTDAEAAEGIAAFLAKRPADFLSLRRPKPYAD
ncbi:oxepin-CoA hydrolase, alternative type [Polaromonas sp. CG_9.11]|uniref:oxepin-CoA hydrolase, alternative type n=1 Tax=Polaromonas sp. CG_9.11 TaxID=2787730 RepID=UPI0018CA81B2|nr:enoyl-CoA hydratase [Polaromonas sp. CG_9.11]MBG6077744.1 enoyl-CoA hydratase/carnithine racemase [Polaromonas sp. CG_9.11]